MITRKNEISKRVDNVREQYKAYWPDTEELELDILRTILQAVERWSCRDEEETIDCLIRAIGGVLHFGEGRGEEEG